MTVYRWSTLVNNQTISPFNRTADVIRFDDAGISAASVVVQSVSGMVRFTFGGKAVTVNMPFFAVTTSNVTFDNGSLLLVGDNLPGTGFDNTGGVLTGGSGNDQLIAGDGGYELFGGGGNDVLLGGPSNDTLDGQAGNDRMTGGAGDDLYFVDSTGDVIGEAPAQGVADAVISTAPTYTLSNNIESLELAGSAPITAFGNAQANIMTGNNAANLLYGLAGNDDLTGMGGDDRLFGGAGADVLDGGAGFDTALYSWSTVGLTIDMTGSEPSTGEAAGDAWGSIEGIVGSAFNDRITGDAEGNNLHGLAGDDRLMGITGNDALLGGAGADFLDGGLGADTLFGEAGNDTFFFDTQQADGDRVVDFVGNGAAAGDQIVFNGYGSAADGATFIQLDATHWQVTSVGGDVQETITFLNAAAIHSSDYTFIV